MNRGLSTGMLNVFRRLVAGERSAVFAFHPYDGSPVDLFGAHDAYIHIPYCRNRCRFCPYNTRPYDPSEFRQFFQSLAAETRRAAAEGATAAGRSLYIGGGTPTCACEHLRVYLSVFSEALGAPSSIAVETTPEELSPPCLRALKDAGVTQLSVGIQSFDRDTLAALGRGASARDRRALLALAADAGFANLNVDLMHSTRDGTLSGLERDIRTAMASGADQITVYPLFDFSSAATVADRTFEGVRMPTLSGRRRFYRLVWSLMESEGFSPVSVWSFRREGKGPSFSSVQRHGFIGLGPGAATSLDDRFLFNTFDTRAWMERLGHEQSPYSLQMPLSRNLRALYDLYWELYACHLPLSLSRDLRNRRFLSVCAAAVRGLGFARADGRLTEKGAFWIHWLQNLYVLDYIDRVWTASKATPFPERVDLTP